MDCGTPVPLCCAVIGRSSRRRWRVRDEVIWKARTGGGAAGPEYGLRHSRAALLCGGREIIEAAVARPWRGLTVRERRRGGYAAHQEATRTPPKGIPGSLQVPWRRHKAPKNRPSGHKMGSLRVNMAVTHHWAPCWSGSKLCRSLMDVVTSYCAPHRCACATPPDGYITVTSNASPHLSRPEVSLNASDKVTHDASPSRHDPATPSNHWKGGDQWLVTRSAAC